MRKVFILFTAILFLTTACTRPSEVFSDEITLVATLFPQYDFARQIAGEHAKVTLLLPPGTESHTYEPTPADMTSVYNASLFLYTGAEMEPWAETILKSAPDKLTAVNLSSVVETPLTVDDEHDDSEDDGGGHSESHHHQYDPHFWLDLSLAIKMVELIEQNLSRLDPDNAEDYRANASALAAELQDLDDDTFEAVSNTAGKTLVFGGRFAYVYFLERYELEYMTAYDTCSTEAEPGVKKIASIIAYINDNNIPCIYHEELVDPKVARSIAQQTGAELLLFSTAHNVTRSQLDNNITFVEIMRDNLKNIKKGLF